MTEATGEVLCRPVVDVRVVLFNVSDGELRVALRQKGARWSLPRAAPVAEESLDAVADRVLAVQVGGEEQYLEQLYSISQGLPRDWTVSVTYLGIALADIESQPQSAARWFSAGQLPEMDSIDRGIVEYALLRLRAKLGYTTIAFHMLPAEFSLSELQAVYEAVLGRQLDKRNFRRRINAAGFLEATGATRREGSHRPARLYRFRAAHDAETYLTPVWAVDSEHKAADA